MVLRNEREAIRKHIEDHIEPKLYLHELAGNCELKVYDFLNSFGIKHIHLVILL